MAKKISLSLCLLLGIIFAGVPAQAAKTTVATSSHSLLTAQPGIATSFFQIAAEQSAPTQATLTLQDLPPGFTQLPPELAANLASRLEVIRQQFTTGTIKPENFFAFVNPKTFQLVLGFTGKLPNEVEQSKFDASLQQLRQPQARQRVLSLLQEKLKTFGQINVTEYRGIPELDNLANASIGIAVALEMHNQPLNLDVAAFRRNSMGAFTGVIYPTGEKPAVAVGEVVNKLDRRLEDLSVNANSSPMQKLGSTP